MQDLLKMMGPMQEAQKKIQKQLDQLRTTREAGAGAVRVTVNGHKKVLDIILDPDFVNPSAVSTLRDLIIAAINLATEAMDKKVQETVQQNTANILGELSLDTTMT